MMCSNPFVSTDKFKDDFAQNLLKMMDTNIELNLFILAAANASIDSKLKNKIQTQLLDTFTYFKNYFINTLKKGSVLPFEEDDQAVFMKIALSGFELDSVEFQHINQWILQLNHLRAFRPRRQAAKKVISSIKSTFDPNAFNFNRPELKNEIFWQGNQNGKEIILMHNMFPFVPYHLNIIPDPQKNLCQFLLPEYHQYIWNLVQNSNVKNFQVGYNSLGAFASVNHLHFQGFIQEEPLPVTSNLWSHNGGEVNYPKKCFVFTSISDSLKWLEETNSNNVAYNLLYTPEKLYAFPRKFQGTYEQAKWNSGFAWYELSGGFICFSREDYQSLTNEDIYKAFHCLDE